MASNVIPKIEKKKKRKRRKKRTDGEKAPLMDLDDEESEAVSETSFISYGSINNEEGADGSNSLEVQEKRRREEQAEHQSQLRITRAVGQNSPEVQLKGCCCIIRCLMLGAIAVGTIIIAVFNGSILDHTQALKTFNSTTDPKECTFHTHIDGRSTQFAVGLISGLICTINVLIILLNIATFCSETLEGRNAIKVTGSVLYIWIILVLLIIVTTILLILLSIVTFKHTAKQYKEVANGTAPCELNFTFVVTLLFWIYIIPTCILCTLYIVQSVS